MAKALQCPSCGRRHRVSGLPDAPMFRCEGCGQRLKVPDQFRPSVMTSSRHIRQADAGSPESTSVLPPRPAPRSRTAAAAASPAAAARPRPAPRPPVGAVREKQEREKEKEKEKASLPVRLLGWAIALPLGLLATLWVARITGWLSGDRLVDVFTGMGSARYIRVIAVAPVWALFTTLILSLFLEVGRALARRRAEKRAEANGARRGVRRGEPEPFDAPDGGGRGEPRGAAVGEQRRTAAQRGGP
jgi:hypothetical protein